LVGRSRELAEATALMRAHQLLTLTGPGGAGKTRLGLQLAAELADEFPDGVFFVPLASLRDPGLVVPTIAQTLGVRESVSDYFAGRRLLLLLDNLEQVIECARELAQTVEAAPEVKLLVTSREPLRVAGEYEYPL